MSQPKNSKTGASVALKHCNFEKHIVESLNINIFTIFLQQHVKQIKHYMKTFIRNITKTLYIRKVCYLRTLLLANRNANKAVHFSL